MSPVWTSWFVAVIVEPPPPLKIQTDWLLLQPAHPVDDADDVDDVSDDVSLVSVSSYDDDDDVTPAATRNVTNKSQ